LPYFTYLVLSYLYFPYIHITKIFIALEHICCFKTIIISYFISSFITVSAPLLVTWITLYYNPYI
jgi:hypothetical protein